MKPRSYYVNVIARKGTCLGGVVGYQSSLFETYEMAEDWRDEALRANTEAGRDVETCVLDSGRLPEIRSAS